MQPQSLTIELGDAGAVSGLWCSPPDPIACVVLAHGAGAGMAHRSMAAIAEGLGSRGVATLRYQFPYMERGGKRVDPPLIAHAAVRAAVKEAVRLTGGSLPLFAGGRSFGGRMTSQAQALSPLIGVRGLLFFAFPLHNSGRPSDERAKHLFEIRIPMLFLQGSKDSLAELSLLQPLVAALGPLATLKLTDDVDHAFHIPAKTGRKDPEVLDEFLDAALAWMEAL